MSDTQASLSPQPAPVAPTARTIPYEFEHLGRAFADPYHWLQDKTNPEVLAYLEAENAYADAVLKPTAGLQEQLFAEMRGRIEEDDCSVPERRGEYFYYWRIQAGQQYGIHCRKHLSMDAPEQILVDVNALAEGKSYCALGVFEPSPDHRLLAYSVDTTGALIYDLYIVDMVTGEIISGPIPDTAWSCAWASDGRTLFYTVFDAAHRPYRIFRHRAGSDPQQDALVYQEDDEAFFLGVWRTRSGKFLLAYSHSSTTSEVQYLPADSPEGGFRLICPRKHRVEYYVEHHGERFLIRTNDDALNFMLMEVPDTDPCKENWRVVIPHRADTLIEDVDAFRGHLVVSERQDGLQRLRVSAPDGVSDVHYVEFPHPVYAWNLQGNPEFAQEYVRFVYSSLAMPRLTVDYDVTSRTWNVRKRQRIPSGHDPEQYETERLHADAPDGARVPISLVYRKGLRKDGSNSLLLYGYGSYGSCIDPSFNSKCLSLLDRGFVFAIAHIRGGSDLGRQWYEDGRLMHKRNTFTDFIACAERLVALAYTSPDRLAIMGASAGGLLMSAVTNMRPDLFKAVVADVPFTNVIIAMLDPDLPLTITEYEQWGNPNDPAAFDYMLSYSPYENVKAQAYPHILVKTGLNDLQVAYWDPAKWVAKLRSCKTDSNRLLLVTNMGAGHGGLSGRYDHLHEDARVYAFLIESMFAGVKET